MTAAATALDTPASSAAQPLKVDSPVEQLLADAKRACCAARAGVKAEEEGRARFASGTMDLAKALLALRQLCQNDNRVFHRLLSDNGLGEDVLTAHERAALIGFAEHPEIAERVLAATNKRSWKTIWLTEIKSQVDAQRSVVRLDNTPSKSEPNRGGRPPKAPTQSDESPENIIERELVGKCASEWLSADKMALRIRRAPNAVRDNLKPMMVKGLVEQRKAADGVAIEYLIANNKPGAPPDVEALKRKSDDLEFTLLEKDERIVELERALEEARAENVELRRRIARLEAVSDAGLSALPPETVH
jgi:hypothetical protein